MIKTDIYSKSSNTHFFVNKNNENNHISIPPIEKIIINTVKDNKNISRRDIIKKISDEYNNYYPIRLIILTIHKLMKQKLIYLNGELISKFAGLSIEPILPLKDKAKQVVNQSNLTKRKDIVNEIYACGNYNNYPIRIVRKYVNLALKDNK